METETARGVILERIRSALRNTPRASVDVIGEQSRPPTRLPAAPENMLTLFEERLREYDAIVERVASEDVRSAVERILVEHGRPRTVVPAGFPHAWLPDGLAIEADHGLSARELDAFDSVLTTATLAIAETGTVVLQNVPGQGRRAVSLVPDFHLCLVQVRDVLATVPEAISRLSATATLPTTFVSGPSATADIEMTRIKGVHGPRFLHVVLIS